MSRYNIHPLGDLKWIGVDLDDTIVRGVWPEKGVGEPIEENVEKLRRVFRLHPDWRPIIFTARGWEEHELIESALDYYGIPQRRIFCGKPLLRWMIDDKAIPASAPDWADLMD